MLEYLAQVPLFEGLTQRQLQDLLYISQKKQYAPGNDVFYEGDFADGLYIIISGRIKVFKLSLEGKEQVLHIFGPGEPIGEAAVFAGETFPANAQAIEKSELLFFSRQSLLDLFNSDPSLPMKMLGILSKRLRSFTSIIEDLSLKEIPQRLASYFLQQYELQKNSQVITLEVSKGLLAKILGTSQETLSRTLNKMTEQGLIEVNKRQISLLDEEALESLSLGEREL
jgi:CRP/FNR family transcriptional regulator